MRGVNQNRFLFDLPTGSGKSYILAAILALLRDAGEVHRCVICTSSIGILNLADELTKFIVGYDPSRTLTVTSINDVKDRAIFNDNWDIIICGYDTIKYVDEYYYKLNHAKKDKKTGKLILKGVHVPEHRRSPSIPLKEWFGDYKGIVFFDECHLMGGRSSQRTHAIFLNIDAFYYRYFFSATPADKIERFYTILKALDPALVRGEPYANWIGRYYKIGNEYSDYQADYTELNVENWQALQNELAENYGVKRDKSILHLPPAIDIDTINLDMSPAHRAIYERLVNTELEDANGNKQRIVDSFFTVQGCVENPKFLKKSAFWDKLPFDFKEQIEKFDYTKDFKKLQTLDSIIDYECAEMGNKILVFYYHPATLDELKAYYGDKADYLSSDLSKGERDAIRKEFIKNDKKILFASILIANTSFTLTEAKACVFYERQWSSIIHEQCKGRIYRIGTTTEVRYYTMNYNNSIDGLQLTALAAKLEITNSLLKQTTLKPEDWEIIFNGNPALQDELLRSLGCLESPEQILQS